MAINSTGKELCMLESRSTNTPFVIGIAGGTASGKTNVVRSIVAELGNVGISVLDGDRFYKSVPRDADWSTYNFDLPESMDCDAVVDCINTLLERRTTQLPKYDFLTHQRTDETDECHPGEVIIIECLFALVEPKIRKLLDLKLFVDTDGELRLIRRIRRDTNNRGRTLESILYQYETFVKPAHDDVILPSKRHADLIIPHWPNPVAFDVIVQHIKEKLRRYDLQQQLPHVRVLKASPQLTRIHNLLSQGSTFMGAFVANADRLSHMVIEAALEWIHESKDGQQVSICAVSMMPGGDTMERCFRTICPDAPIGKVLVQPNKNNPEEYEVIFSRLPAVQPDSIVLLLDPMLGGGRRIGTAIRHLFEVGAQNPQIMVTCLAGRMDGLAELENKGKDVRIVTSQVDQGEESSWSRLVNFTDKYFGVRLREFSPPETPREQLHLEPNGDK